MCQLPAALRFGRLIPPHFCCRYCCSPGWGRETRRGEEKRKAHKGGREQEEEKQEKGCGDGRMDGWMGAGVDGWMDGCYNLGIDVCEAWSAPKAVFNSGF